MNPDFIVLSATMSFLYVVLFTYLHFQDRDNSLGLWTIAGSIIIGEFIADSYFNHVLHKGMSPIQEALDWTALLLVSLFMLWGTYCFLERRMSKVWFITFALLILTSCVNTIVLHNQIINIVQYLFYGLGFVLSGIMLLRQNEYGGLWKYVSGWSLIIWGSFLTVGHILKCTPDQPTWESTIDYVLITIVAAITMTGILLIYINKKVARDKNRIDIMQNVAHDLKNKVMIIKNYTRSIKKGIMPNESLEDSLDIIDSEIGMLENDVKGILYLNKLNSSIEDHKKGKIILNELVAHCVDLFRYRRPEITLEKNIEPCIIVGDQDQWKIVLENSLDNQLRYAKKYIKISLNTHEEEKMAILRISNDGPHIEPETMKGLFNEYKTGKGGMFGLGMYIIKKIVTNHQGTVYLENEKEGVSYNFKIPCYTDEIKNIG